MKYILRGLVTILIVAVLASFAVPVSAAKLTAAEYADLFERASDFSEEDPLPELEKAFLADPMSFVKALAKEDYHTMFNVRFVTLNGADWASDPERYAHRDALLRIAYGEKLTQPQRRVVSYMLSSTKILKDYVIYTDEIDYTELFSRAHESDSNSSSQISTELRLVFDRDPKAFLQAAGKIEEQETVLKVLDCLAYDHYYRNYDREEVENAIQIAVDSGELDEDALDFVGHFWREVNQLIGQNGPLPTRPTVPPSTISTSTTVGRPILHASKKSIYAGENMEFSFDNFGDRTVTLIIRSPDGTENTYQAAEKANSMVLSFEQKGEYRAQIAAQKDGGSLYSDVVRFRVVTKYIPATNQPSTQFQDDTPPSGGNPVIWIIAGVIVVALGAQVVMLVRNRKKD